MLLFEIHACIMIYNMYLICFFDVIDHGRFKGLRFSPSGSRDGLRRVEEGSIMVEPRSRQGRWVISFPESHTVAPFLCFGHALWLTIRAMAWYKGTGRTWGGPTEGLRPRVAGAGQAKRLKSRGPCGGALWLTIRAMAWYKGTGRTWGGPTEGLRPRVAGAGQAKRLKSRGPCGGDARVLAWENRFGWAGWVGSTGSGRVSRGSGQIF
ncbi:hypothetical protein F511_22450 [Dorcoceras hygrometricum]|uniref:Uncharacterized protein n=1 Tax=Dorcoceras hygrometricum TaxID=472368 RepID=A0A2Z7AQQ9_9LAMI|nr:hypothetical protein F511_22450 [Dorcoceras hygrometricum]